MSYTLLHYDTPGGTFYAILGVASADLADWLTDRVALVEGSGANTGRYTATVDAAGPWVIFSGASQPASWNAHIAIGGGDASQARQEDIYAKLTAVTRVYTNPRNPNRLELIRGDAYDGTSWPVLSWTLGKDCTGATVQLTIRHAETDELLLSVSGSGTLTGVTVTLTSTDTAALPVGEHKFDCQVTFSSTSKQSPGLGVCEVIEDQSR